jgi:hypothetical protein
MPRFVAVIAMAVVSACQLQYWFPAALTPSEQARLGCYALHIGPWPALHLPSSLDTSAAPTDLQVQLDTLRWRYGDDRRLYLLGVRKNRQPFAYWNLLGPDSMTMRIGRGVEGQGLEMRFQIAGDSLRGLAIYHVWVDISRVASAAGTRTPCPLPPQK